MGLPSQVEGPGQGALGYMGSPPSRVPSRCCSVLLRARGQPCLLREPYVRASAPTPAALGQHPWLKTLRGWGEAHEGEGRWGGDG